MNLRKSLIVLDLRFLDDFWVLSKYSWSGSIFWILFKNYRFLFFRGEILLKLTLFSFLYLYCLYFLFYSSNLGIILVNLMRGWDPVWRKLLVLSSKTYGRGTKNWHIWVGTKIVEIWAIELIPRVVHVFQIIMF